MEESRKLTVMQEGVAFGPIFMGELNLKDDSLPVVLEFRSDTWLEIRKMAHELVGRYYVATHIDGRQEPDGKWRLLVILRETEDRGQWMTPADVERKP